MVCAALVSCGRAGEKELSDAVALYRKGSAGEALPRIEEAVMKIASLRKFSGKAEAGGGMVFTRGKDELRLQWPREVTLDILPGYFAVNIDPESGRSAYSKGGDITLLDSGGSRDTTVTAPGEGPVSGISVSKDGVLYLQNGILYELGSGGEPKKALDAAVVAQPKTGIAHRAELARRGGLCAVNCGNAGAYNLSVVRMDDKKIMFRDFPNSSLKFGFDGESVFCITGAAGGWTLVKRAVATGKAEPLRRFTGLLDVEFAGDIMAAAEEKGVSLVDLAGKDFLQVPFAYGLAGQSGGKLVLAWKGALYLVDQRLLFDKIRLLRAELPALFPAVR